MDVAAYLGYEQVYGDKPSQSSLQDIIANYPLPCWTNLIFKAQAALFKGSPLSKVSDDTVAEFCPGALRNKLDRLRSDSDGTKLDVLTIPGLQVLHQQAILHAPLQGDADLTKDEGRGDFLKALMMATYLCDMDIPYDPRTRERILSIIIRDYYSTPKMNRDCALVRYWKLLTDPVLEQASPSLTNRNLDALFEEYFGCSAKTFMALAFAMCVTWIGNLGRDGMPGFFSYNSLLDQVAIPSNTKERFLAHCSLSLCEYRNALEAEIERDSRYWQFCRKTFKQFPYMVIERKGEESIIAPVDLEWAAAKWSSGIYYSIFNAVHEDRKLRQEVSSQLGRRFQRYVLNRLISAVGSTCEGEHRYGGRDTPDIMVREPGNVLLIEVKFTGVRISTMLTGNVDEFERDLGEDGNGLLDASRQLTKAILEFVQRKFSVGSKYYSDECIHPIVVLSNPVPMTHIMRQWYDRKLQERQLLTHCPELRSVPISRVEILSADEVEVLADILGREAGAKRFTELLKSWRSHPSLKGEEFGHFCLDQFTSARSQAIAAEVKGVQEEIKKAIPFCT